MMSLLFRFGLVGLFLVSVVDSSFVPLPIPGVTDILVILYAANHLNVIMLVALTTAGSALGGFLSHWAGQVGGMAFLEKHVPERYLKPAQSWVESHAILAVALPAILPPPVPLSPFVLVAGAGNMSRGKFMLAFTTSRLVRHMIAAWLGVRYGKQVLGIWAHFSQRWATTVLIVFWGIIIVFTAIGIWKLVQTSRSFKRGSQPNPQPTT
jgi:membrane protein YqaA with SNARE-associated domain